GELTGNCDRNLDRFRLKPVFDVLETRRKLLEPAGDACQRSRRLPLCFGAQLRLRRGDAAVIAARLGFRERRLVGIGCDRRLRLLGARSVAEIGVEQEFCLRCHASPQYTSSSSARFLEIMISPFAARSLAKLTSSACASSTSRSRTG